MKKEGEWIFINSEIISRKEEDGKIKYIVDILGQKIEVDDSVMYNWLQPKNKELTIEENNLIELEEPKYNEKDNWWKLYELEESNLSFINWLGKNRSEQLKWYDVIYNFFNIQKIEKEKIKNRYK